MAEQLKGFRGTPGPYSVSDVNQDDLMQYARFGNVVVYAEHDCDIHPVADCSCNHSCRMEYEQVANARLFAKSYELALFVQKVAGAGYMNQYEAANFLEDCRTEAHALLASVIGAAQ